MSNKLIPNPKEPVDSTDYIYGKRMEPYEDRMNFFLNDKLDVKKDDVKEEDKKDVDGLESVLQRFTSYGAITLPILEEERTVPIVDGVEAAGKVRSFINFLIQLAKDAVAFILNLINNRIARLDNREFRVSTNRKRDGFVSHDVKYPSNIRRLIDPLTISLDPNWVKVSLNNVNKYYINTVKTYQKLTDLIKDTDHKDFDLAYQLNKTMDVIKTTMGFSNEGAGLISEILPGNRRLTMDPPNPFNLDKVGIYFQASTNMVKLYSDEYEPNGPMIDGVLKTIRNTVKDIRSNQSTISQLYRTFEKEAKKFQVTNSDLGLEQRQYLNWLIRVNKRLMTVNLQYILNCMDAGLDFVNSGLRK